MSGLDQSEQNSTSAPLAGAAQQRLIVDNVSSPPITDISLRAKSSPRKAGKRLGINSYMVCIIHVG